MRQNLCVCLLLRCVEKLSNLKRFINSLVLIFNDCATENWVILLLTPQLINQGDFSNQDNKYYLKINEFLNSRSSAEKFSLSTCPCLIVNF